MALQYLGLLISQAREETGETDYSDALDPDQANGVPQSVPTQAAKEAIIHCQNSLYLAAPQLFDVISEVDVVAGQVEYSLAANAYLGSAIAAVEYSANGQNNSYYPLSNADYAYFNGGTGIPGRFNAYGDGKLRIDPAPNAAGGKLRITYGAHLDEPALRKGKVLSATIAGPPARYIDIVLDAADTTLDDETISQNEILCVNDRFGEVKYYNIPYYGYNTSTKTLNLVAGLTPTDGALTSLGSITPGDYITMGAYSTTHIKLDRIAEPIVLAFLRRRFYLTKSSTDVSNEEDNIAAFTKEMVAAYKRRIRTQKKIPFTGRFERIGRV